MKFDIFRVFSKLQKNYDNLNNQVTSKQKKIKKTHNQQLDEFEKAKANFESKN